MKKALSSLIIIFLLAFTSSSHGQIKRKGRTVKPPTDIQTVDLNKVNQQVTRPDLSNLQNLKVKHFTSVKFGIPSQKQGANELMVVDRLFPVLNTTKVTLKGRITSPKVISVTEDLDINVNVRDFSHFSESSDSWLKPGQIFTANSYISGQPVAVVTPRNPIVLAISLPGVANTSYPVQNPELNSKLFEAEDYLIEQNARPPAGNLSFSFHKIHSVEEMEFKLTGKYRGVLGSFSRKFGLSAGNQQSYHYYMLEFRQHVFSIQAGDMPLANIFKQPVTDMSGYVYIDEVKYGRKGIIIFKSTRTLEELGVRAAANYHFGLSEVEMRTTYNQLSKKKEVEVFAVFYGGSSAQAILSMENTVKNGVTDIFTYIKSQPNDHRLALPVGYSLKNMNNQEVGQKSNKTQTVTTKSPVPLPSVYKLKVTLTDIQCINGRDGGGTDPDDYAIGQYIVYKALGKDKKFVSREINKFPNEIDGRNNINPLISGSENRQIHVKEDGDIKKRNRNMINNSMVFHITLDELNDPNASFEIFTRLNEYSTKWFSGTLTIRGEDIKLLGNNEPVKVKVRDVVEILQGLRSLRETTTYPDLTIGKGAKFHNFGSGFMHLANIQKRTPLVLEGPIRVGSSGAKAAVWIQFELIE